MAILVRLSTNWPALKFLSRPFGQPGGNTRGDGKTAPAGQTKSVRFRELMGEKMVKANLISLIKSYGL